MTQQEQRPPAVPTEEARGKVTPARVGGPRGLKAVHNMFFLVRLYTPYTLAELKGRMMVQTAGTTLYLFTVGEATWNNEAHTEVRVETEGPVFAYPAISHELVERLLALRGSAPTHTAAAQQQKKKKRGRDQPMGGFRIDSITLSQEGIELFQEDDTCISLDAQSAWYLMNWLCKHVVMLDLKRREQEEQEEQQQQQQQQALSAPTQGLLGKG